MQDRSFAFEQIECENDHVADEVANMADESERWLVVWRDGSQRTTGIVGLAWYAREFDDEATVSPAE